jgi:hypothetical protein
MYIPLDESSKDPTYLPEEIFQDNFDLFSNEELASLSSSSRHFRDQTRQELVDRSVMEKFMKSFGKDTFLIKAKGMKNKKLVINHLNNTMNRIKLIGFKDDYKEKYKELADKFPFVSKQFGMVMNTVLKATLLLAENQMENQQIVDIASGLRYNLLLITQYGFETFDELKEKILDPYATLLEYNGEDQVTMKTWKDTEIVSRQRLVISLFIRLRMISCSVSSLLELNIPIISTIRYIIGNVDNLNEFHQHVQNEWEEFSSPLLRLGCETPVEYLQNPSDHITDIFQKVQLLNSSL